jgi:hypothetical protein
MRLTFDPPTAIGAPVMAFGIFAAAALQRLPGGPGLTGPLAAALVLAWAVLALALLRSLRRRGIARHTRPLVGGFAIGTWIASTAVVARVLMLAAPGAAWLVRGFFLVALALWLWFIPIAVARLLRLAADRRASPTGVILLTTVATQSVALMTLRLFDGVAVLRWGALALIGLGFLGYLLGLYLVVRRYAASAWWRLAADWDSTNCILHGALSITGLAAVVSGAFAPADLLDFWLVAAAAFAVVEGIEIARLWARWRELGWRRAVAEYDVTQWARNFTFGMLYAFTLALSERVPPGGGHAVLAALRGGVLAYGQYAVLALLLIETLLWGARGARDGARPPAASGR